MKARFVKIETAFVAWENAKSGRNICAIVLSILQDFYSSRERLKIEEDNDYMILSSEFIANNIENSLDIRTITRTLKILENEDIIEQIVKNEEHYIKINIEKVEEIRKEYALENYNSRYFIVYYFMLAFAQKNYRKISMLAYMGSRFIQELEEGTFKMKMSIYYIHRKFCELFSIKQERLGIEALIECGILKRPYGRGRYFIMNVDTIKAIIDQHYADKKNDYQQYSFSIHKKHGSLDGVKSGTYTAEEIDEINARTEKLKAAGEQWYY